MSNYKNLDSYELLEIFSQIKSFSSFDRNAPTWTPRLNKIVQILDDCEIEYTVKHFNTAGYSKQFTNIYVSFSNGTMEPGVLFLAHHDISNAESQNCQDNTASVCNLLKMILHLKDNPPKSSVHFAIVDTEEHVNPYSCGSQVLSEDIKVGLFGNIQACINLELTGLGKNIWVSSFESFEEKTETFRNLLNAFPVNTPYNDAWVLSTHGVPAMCIGILPDNEFTSIVESRSFPSTWGLCHRTSDTIDKISREDMNEFVGKLLGLVV